jgi:phosphopantothenoylcysteine decarboxylase/phosphopantothenate--cysteine ligase
MLKNHHIALYVSAALNIHQVPSLIQGFIAAGAEVRVAMTPGAQEFITPLTLQTLSQHPVYTNRFGQNNVKHVSHIDLGDWAELAVVAPATADIIGKMANGIADDIATTALVATVAPKVVVPAMHPAMLANVAVQRNLKQLEADGMTLLKPDVGFQADSYQRFFD